MKTPQKINVLDVGISQVKINDILELVPKFIKTDNKGYVTVTGAHGIGIESKEMRRFDDLFIMVHTCLFQMVCLAFGFLNLKSKNIERCLVLKCLLK